jgi:hypothetical protein
MSEHCKSDDWKTYRTRFVVQARQLAQPCTLTDSKGREHHGRAGDYLIQSSEGLRIARREIFEDVYVAMESAGAPSRSLEGEASELRARESEQHESGGHGFSHAEIRSPEIGALAPGRPASEHVNLAI